MPVITPELIAAVGGFIVIVVQQYLLVKSSRSVAAVHVIAEKQSILAETVAKVETNVNSKASIAEGRELTLIKERDLLREMLAKSETAAALLAQAAAASRGVGRASDAVALESQPQTAAESLASIDTHAAEIADNTKPKGA